MDADLTNSLTLPWERLQPHPDDGFRVKTEIKQSTIPEAGLGRFVLEDVPAGTTIKSSLLVPVTSPDIFQRNRCIYMQSQADIDYLLNRYLRISSDADNNKKRLADFIVTENWDGKLIVYIRSTSGFINHSANSSIVKSIQNDHVNIVVIKDVAKGDELLLNYQLLHEVAFYDHWCRKNNVQSSKCQVMNLGGGKINGS